METYTNQSKSSSPFANDAITGVDLWDDKNVAWDDPMFPWDMSLPIWTDLNKPSVSSSTTSNPFFLWLFMFTQPETTETGTIWSNRNKQ
jgi:hypothetical protein